MSNVVDSEIELVRVLQFASTKLGAVVGEYVLDRNIVFLIKGKDTIVQHIHCRWISVSVRAAPKVPVPRTGKRPLRSAAGAR